MNKSKVTTAAVISTAAWLYAGLTQADPLEAAVLKSCSAKPSVDVKSDGGACKVYIRAFISGAIVYDKLFVSHLYHDHSDASNFFKRAYETRLGKSTERDEDLNQYLFCLPEDANENAVAANVMLALDTPLESESQLHHQILQKLRGDYPCE